MEFFDCLKGPSLQIACGTLHGDLKEMGPAPRRMRPSYTTGQNQITNKENEVTAEECLTNRSTLKTETWKVSKRGLQMGLVNQGTWTEHELCSPGAGSVFLVLEQQLLVSRHICLSSLSSLSSLSGLRHLEKAVPSLLCFVVSASLSVLSSQRQPPWRGLYVWSVILKTCWLP